jgi:Ca2+/Na+ antiporter
MIDGLMYSMLIIVGVLIYRWTKQGCKMDESFWLLFLATVFSLNLKFNGVVYVVICYVAAFVILLLQKQWRTTLARYTIITSLMVIVGLAAFGYPTYVRNTIFGGHPFYPLYGNKKFAKEIADIITPKNMQSENRFRKWEMSTFSEPVYLDNNGVTVYRRIFDPTILINIFSDKYHVYARGSAKVAGFGPLSAECFYIAVVVLILSLIFVSFKTQREMMLIIFFLLLSIFIIAECWYARYVPQQWLIVGLTTVLAYRHRHKKMFLYAGTLLMFYASANTLSVGTGIEVVQIIEDRIINKQIDELKSCNDTATIFPSWVTSFEYRLKENNISYKYETDSLLASTFNMFEGTLAVHPRYKPCK